MQGSEPDNFPGIGLAATISLTQVSVTWFLLRHMSTLPDRSHQPKAKEPADPKKLIGLIYSAADDVSQWSVVIEQIAIATHSRFGFVFLLDLSDGGHEFRKTVWEDYWGVSEETWQKMRLFPPNPFALKRHIVPSHGTAIGSDLISDDRYWKSDYYKQVEPHIDMGRMLGQVLNAGNGSFGSFTLWRYRSDPDYGRAEYDLLHRLAPHLRRSAQLSIKLSEYDAERKMLKATAEALPFALILVDQFGSPLYMNPAAQRALGRSSHRTLVRSFDIDAQNSPTDSGSGLTTFVKLPSGGQIATVVPLFGATSRFAELAPEAQFVILFRTTAAVDLSSTNSLQQAWGLTPSEAKLALALLTGCSLQDYAESRNIKITTVRTHLKSCKSKFGISRTSELIAFLAQHML